VLADEVGMGKTIEAGVIISELAERGLISSMLIVADNMDNWREVLLGKFGVPEITEVKTADDINANCVNKQPQRPMIMTLDDFCALRTTPLSGVCFDVIAVDEVHNFGIRDEYKRGLHVLSYLMRIKNQKNIPYCILVSGTPHNGNLNTMFNLWYFISRHGEIEFGEDGEAADAKMSAAMQAAKKHYTDYLCNGANTIAEFIENWKKTLLESKYAEAYKAARPAIIENLKRAKILKPEEKTVRSIFLSDEKNKAIKDDIRNITAKKYRDLLGSFMIRQSRAILNRAVKKKAKNYYFCPVKSESGKVTLEHTGSARSYFVSDKTYSIELDYTDFYGDSAVECQGRKLSLDKFFELVYPGKKTDASEGRREDFDVLKERHIGKTSLIFKTLDQIADFGAEGRTRAAWLNFYRDKFAEFQPECQNLIELIDSTVKGSDEIFEEKAEKFILEADAHPDDSIIVFFDYDAADERRRAEPARLYRYLIKKSEIEEKAKRVLERVVFSKSYGSSDAAAEEFLKRQKAVLFADGKLSESYNLQFKCHVVINFSVCYSPIKMDQRIGRVDRLGQDKNIEIISFAVMSDIEGFILSFFNKIGLFGAWKDDIILVTGCDNANLTMMYCKRCSMIYLYLGGQSTENERCSCGADLAVMAKTMDYECSKSECNFRVMRRKTPNSYVYTCYIDNDAKLAAVENGGKSEAYICDKRCALKHCGRIKGSADKCAISEYLDKPETNINILRKACADCRAQNKNLCVSCGIDIDVLGRYPGGQNHISCAKCVNQSCKPFEVKVTGDCPKCGAALRPRTPTTFDSFISVIWEEKKNFLPNFEYETEKIGNIVETLRYIPKRRE